MLLFGNINRGLAEYGSVPGAVLVDVREAEEFAAGHIPGAVNLPLSRIKTVALPKDTPLFLYCLRGSRSLRAMGVLKRMGYTNLRSIGGINTYKGELTK